MHRRAARVVPLLLSLAACAAPPVHPDAVDAIERGMPATEVFSRLGPPHDVEETSPFGGRTWIYRSDASGHSPHRIAFDDTDRVAQVITVRRGNSDRGR